MGGEPPEANAEWERAIEKFIEQIEAVSSHFGYSEEYVLDHTPEWLGRKYKHMTREKMAANRQQVLNGAQSLALVFDGMFNKGKGFAEILPPTFEEWTGNAQGVANSDYVTAQWWTPEKSQQ